MSDLPVWARKIQELTLRSGLSQSEIARRADLNRDAFGRYHNGKTKPPFDKAARIAEAFSVAPGDIDPSYRDVAGPEARVEVKKSPFSVGRPADGNPNNVHLTIACDLPIHAAMDIVRIVQEAMAVRREEDTPKNRNAPV